MDDAPPSTTIARETGRSVFGQDPAGYHAARLDYPPALYELIQEHSEYRTLEAIAEIGAGTGLATRHLLPMATKRYVAIEPDPALAAYLQGQFSESVFQVVNADFVSAPVAGPFDLIAAAASFHWLDPVAALARIKQLLRPGGTVALWWNSYRNPGIGDAFADATMPLLHDMALPPSESAGGHYSLDNALHVSRLKEAGFADVLHHVYRRERVLTAADAQALYATYSFVRAAGPERRRNLLNAIGTLVDVEFEGLAPNVVLTAIYLGRKPTDARTR